MKTQRPETLEAAIIDTTIECIDETFRKIGELHPNLWEGEKLYTINYWKEFIDNPLHNFSEGDKSLLKKYLELYR